MSPPPTPATGVGGNRVQAWVGGMGGGWDSPSTAQYGPVQPCIAQNNAVGSCMAKYSLVWPSTALYSPVWLSTDQYRAVQSYMAMYSLV